MFQKGHKTNVGKKRSVEQLRKHGLFMKEWWSTRKLTSEERKERPRLWYSKRLAKKGKNCIDCGVKLRSLSSMRCYKCSAKNRVVKYPNTIFKKGKDCVNWKGGITPLNHLLRTSPRFKQWRIEVFSRDNWTCQNCGKSGRNQTYLEAHHKKPFSEYPEERFNIDNGITLCTECHMLLDRCRFRLSKKPQENYTEFL
jgi:5-methylcytosine-specific restriction endonuclease McrA